MHHKLRILYRISIIKFVVLGLTALSTLSYCLTHTVAQATSLEVVAIVNDEIISSIDLDQRIKLSRLGSQTQDNEKVKNIIRDNALESLINEAVISQELRTLGLKIPKSSIDKAVSSIEKRNRIPSGKLGTILAQNNIAMEALIQQVQGELGLMIIAQHLFGKKYLSTTWILKRLCSVVFKIHSNPYFHFKNSYYEQIRQKGDKKAPFLLKILSQHCKHKMHRLRLQLGGFPSDFPLKMVATLVL